MKVKTSKKLNFILNPILVAMLGLPMVAQAENNTDTTIVTANRTSQSISDIAATVLVIEGEEIAEQVQSGVEFKSALANLIPSLDVGSESRTNANQNMRGRSTLVMIDGVSLNSAGKTLSRQFDAINPFNIARIEVVSGASAIYGGGSSGGIINIITKKGLGKEGFSGESSISLRSGFNDSEDLQYQVAQSVAYNTDKLNSRFSAAYEQTGGMYDTNGDMILHDFAQTTSQFVSEVDLMANVGFNISETKRIELLAQYYDSGQDSDYGIDLGAFGSNLLSGNDLEMVEGFELDDQASTERFLATANYSDNNFYNQTLNFQLFARSESSSFNPALNSSFTTISASEQNTSAIGSKLVLTSTPVDKLSLVYGVDASYEKFDATQTFYDGTTYLTSGGLDLDEVGQTGRYPDIDTSSFAAFLQADYELTPRLDLNAGLRYQYTHIKVGDFVGYDQQYLELAGLASDGYYDEIEGGSNSYSNTLANIGFIYELTQTQKTWVTFSQGFEIPDTAKYYGNADYNADGSVANSVNVSDSPLEGIQTNSIELGWRLTQEALSVQLAGYFSLSDKQVELDDSNYSIDVIDDDKRIYGLEGQVSYFLNNEFSFGGNFHYVISEAKTNGSWEDLTASTASTSKASAYVNWEKDRFNTRLQTTQMFDYEDADDNELEGYNTVDLLTNVRLPLGNLQVGITNLFNTEYQTLWSQRSDVFYGLPNLTNYQGQGRTYSLNYNVEF